MILILSTAGDVSTSEVAEWLLYYNKEYTIINTDEAPVYSINLFKNNVCLKVMGKSDLIDLSQVTSIWNRRLGYNPHEYAHSYLNRKAKSDFWDWNFQTKMLEYESKLLFDYIHYALDRNSLKALGDYSSNMVNKLVVLDIAKEFKIDIPETYIINTKSCLLDLLQQAEAKEQNLISKPIGEIIYRNKKTKNEETFYSTYVEKVDKALVDAMPDTFFPSLFQVEIKKDYELRIFYLCGEFYTMAIFSQEYKMARTDFRKYSGEKPLKCVPYSLPNEIKNKLKIMMDRLNLNTGSIDMIVDVEQKYYFLEVNPSGQFGMTSEPCNYYLEKKIAQYL